STLISSCFPTLIESGASREILLNLDAASAEPPPPSDTRKINNPKKHHFSTIKTVKKLSKPLFNQNKKPKTLAVQGFPTI
ncbi:hypothetical protein, partial [Brevibacillus laterosporus]|uniref:hypothetical protein n=1 Tax=Brevibacillus laterosporus TaxID=1465 RepID=UPI002651476F